MRNRVRILSNTQQHSAALLPFLLNQHLNNARNKFCTNDGPVVQAQGTNPGHSRLILIRVPVPLVPFANFQPAVKRSKKSF
jgi:hypothetical protein